MPTETINRCGLSRKLNRAKKILSRKGWTYRDAAPVLGVTYQHLSEVLNGHRESRRILKGIDDIPSNN